MFLATIACYLALLAVIYFFDPFVGGWATLIFFYTSLFLALTGTFAIFGLLIRLIFTKDKLVFRKVIISFRQGIWLAIVVVVCLHLKSVNLLIWRNIIILIIALVLLEVFFISYKSKPSLKI
jgi:hypothetical protein